MSIDSQVNRDELFPFLMVAGAGDAAVLAPPPSNGAPIWSNTIVRTRRPWSDRLPEYISTCWMTFVLLGISFVVFYAIGMLVIYRAETYFLMKCNDTKPAGDVFYHDLIPRGGIFPLMAYSSYLATMASRYPMLRFHVIFLLDDSVPYVPKRSMYSKLYPYTTFYEEFTVYNKREVRDFQRKHPNMNITVMPLSKMMSLTPLKTRWRTIPVRYLPFYARVWSVWAYGGVGLDLVIENELHRSGQLSADRKTGAILRQHNDGINAERYIATLNNIERYEESAIFASFFNMVQRMLNETISIFNNSLPFAFAGENSELNHSALGRNKRDVLEEKNSANNSEKNINTSPIVNIFLANTSVVNVTDEAKKNVYQLQSFKDTTGSEIKTETPNNITEPEFVEGKEIENITDEVHVYDTMNTTEMGSKARTNKSDMSRVVLVYDFFVSEPIHFEIETQKVMSNIGIQNPPKFVTMDSDGTFIAATTRVHPFLASILSAGCKRMHPKLAIQNALMTQCSGIFRDSYCDSIYIF